MYSIKPRVFYKAHLPCGKLYIPFVSQEDDVGADFVTSKCTRRVIWWEDNIDVLHFSNIERNIIQA